MQNERHTSLKLGLQPKNSQEWFSSTTDLQYMLHFKITLITTAELFHKKKKNNTICHGSSKLMHPVVGVLYQWRTKRGLKINSFLWLVTERVWECAKWLSSPSDFLVLYSGVGETAEHLCGLTTARCWESLNNSHYVVSLRMSFRYQKTDEDLIKNRIQFQTHIRTHELIL